MPAQHAAPATQQEAAKAEAAKPEVVTAARALMKNDFMEFLQRLMVFVLLIEQSHQSGGFQGRRFAIDVGRLWKVAVAPTTVGRSALTAAAMSAGVEAHEPHPEPEGATTQHGSEPPQQTVQAEATALSANHTSASVATTRAVEILRVDTQRSLPVPATRCSAELSPATPNRVQGVA